MEEGRSRFSFSRESHAEKGVRTIPTIVIRHYLYISPVRQFEPHSVHPVQRFLLSLNAIIRFTRTPGRRMSREFLRTCSNMLPLLAETVEAEQRYRERNRFFYYDESIEERREKERKRHGKKDETH